MDFRPFSRIVGLVGILNDNFRSASNFLSVSFGERAENSERRGRWTADVERVSASVFHMFDIFCLYMLIAEYLHLVRGLESFGAACLEVCGSILRL